MPHDITLRPQAPLPPGQQLATGFIVLSQAAYDALNPPDPDTVYLIVE